MNTDKTAVTGSGNAPSGNYAMYEADREAKRKAQPSLPAVTARVGQLKRDGKVVFEGTEGEAMAFIHRNHCYSYTHALKHEGFSYDTAEEISIRAAMKP